MVFSRQEYWSGLPSHPLGDPPNPGIKPVSPTWQADFFFLNAELPGTTSLMIAILECEVK